jgi:hypothetical protein
MKKHFIPLTCFALLFLTGVPLHAGSADRLAMLDGARVHYQSYGSGGSALVFIHGWTCDLYVLALAGACLPIASLDSDRPAGTRRE